MKAFDGSIGRPFPPAPGSTPTPTPHPCPCLPNPNPSIHGSVSLGHAQRAFHQQSPLTTGERSLSISKIYVVNNLRETKKPKLFLNYLMEALKYVSIFPYQIQLFFVFFFFGGKIEVEL